MRDLYKLTPVLDALFLFFVFAFISVSMFDTMFQLNACNWFNWIMRDDLY